MSKSVYLNLCTTQYKKLLKDLSSILLNENLKLQSNKTLSQSKINIDDFTDLAFKWWNDETKYISLIHSEAKGVSVRIYRKNFKLTGTKLLVKNKEDHGVIYFRYRERKSQKLISKKLGIFTPSTFKSYLKIANKLTQSNSLGISILKELDKDELDSKTCSITLDTFLNGEFYETKLNENPKTVDKKVKNVTRNFRHLLKQSLKDIDSTSVKAWLKSKERKLNRRQIEAGESRWVVKPSTLKEAICTLRSCIELAKERGIIQSHDLYSVPRFKIDNEIIRYLSENEEQRLYKAINDRNEEKLQTRIRTIEHRKQRNIKPPEMLNRCAFADHVSPFIILFKECGIRPGTIMNSRWSDIDFESKFFRIRKSIDKKSLANFVPLNELAFQTLKEWRKHHIHTKCLSLIEKKSDAWLFPSPQDPKYQLTTIKTAWQRLVRVADIHNFRFYDLRHDFASKIMMKTGNIYLVSHLLNHRQIETTKRYAHLMDQTKMQAVQTLDQHRSNNALPTFLQKNSFE
jgi:integrase